MKQIDTISFHTESIEFTINNVEDVKSWLYDIASSYDKTIEHIEYIFCSDDYLLEINKEHLNHDYYTDIITFPFNYNPVEATIFISIDRVRDNATELKINVTDELHRVIAHGLLHMLGLNDKSPEEELLMREAEDKALISRKF